MTSVSFSIRKPKDGGTDPVKGKLSFTPVRRYFNEAKDLVLPFPFEVALSVDGKATVGLTPTTAAYVWAVTIIPTENETASYTRYVEVPDSKTEVAFADLVDVDASTLIPTSMGNVIPVKMLPPASSLTEAESLSDQYADYLVWYPEGATASTARAMVASIEQSVADAQTMVALSNAASQQATSDSQTVAETLARVQSMAATASNAAASTEATVSTMNVASATASETINTAVQQVQSMTEDIRAKSDAFTQSAADASTAISSAVQSVRDQAEQSKETIRQAEEDAKADMGEHSGSGEGTQTGEGTSTGGQTVTDTDADGAPEEE